MGRVYKDYCFIFFMVLIEVNKLTRDVFKEFYDKEELGIRLVADVETRKLYIVPSVSFHFNIVLELLGADEFYIKKNPLLASHLISVFINIEKNEIRGLIIGIGSIELNLKIGHTKSQLDLAHAMVVNFIETGDLEKSSDFKERNANPTLR